MVEDQGNKDAIAEIYRANWTLYRSLPRPDYHDGDSRGERLDKVLDSSQYLADNFHRAPLFLIACQWGRPEELPAAMAAGYWGSLLPAVWSFMLALRERGLGSAWTTIHLIGDGEQRVAELLGIPFDKVAQGALLPIAYTLGTDFKPAKRQPLADVLHWDAGSPLRHSTRRSPLGSVDGAAPGKSTTNSVRWAGKRCSLTRTGLPASSVVTR